MTDAEAILWLTPKESQLMIYKARQRGEDPEALIEEAMSRAVKALKCHTVPEYKRALKRRVKEEMQMDDYYLPENFLLLMDEVKIRGSESGR